MSSVRKSALDLTACEQEAIHTPQAIQAACSLLLFDRETGHLAMGSDNLEDVFGAHLKDVLGKPASALFEPQDAEALTQMMRGEEKQVSRYLQLRGRREHFARVFETEGLLGVELNAWEDAQDQPMQLGLDIGNSLQKIEERASGLKNPTDEEMCEFAQLVADEFRQYSGYDRSMVYRFDADWNGEIIGESRSENAPGSFLGLSFPSSDIPAQARRLFVLNRVRPVVDIKQGSAPILPALNPHTGHPVDLSDCSVRAVSPVHVEYLENMGVRATLNIALMAKGKLWGLLSNHHYSAPYRLTPARSATCRLLAEIVSTELTRITENTEYAAGLEVRDCLRAIRSSLMKDNADKSFDALLADRERSMLEVLGCDGLGFVLGGNTFLMGQTPDEAHVAEIDSRIRAILDDQNTDEFATHFAAGLWPDLKETIFPATAGVFATRFPNENCRLLLFRKARKAEITWGGDPYKRIQPGKGDRLHPRKSFEKFTETARDRALPWGPEISAKARECGIGLSELDWLLEWRKTEMELAESRAEVAHAARHDVLTNLPNRRYLSEVLEQKETSIRNWSAVLHVDLDGFKQINDQYGHAAGDTVLVEVAERLRSQTRKEDFCARIGGDEFVVLCGLDLNEKDVEAMGERLVAVMSRPVTAEDETCHFGASIGIAYTQSAPANPEVLLHQADLALYESKRGGRGRVTVFTDELQERVLRTQRLGEDILAGIRGGQFIPWYQPQVDAQTLEVCGVETLLRWEHPTHGTLTPDNFIQIAEDTGHIGTLDAISMERALADYRYWKLEGVDIPSVSLNLSFDRLVDAELMNSIKSAGLPADVFRFELLETIYLDETPKSVEWNLDLLRECGIKIEIDDFGTGKTSIVSLVRLRPDRLKIDRQLVQPVVHSPQSRQLVASIVEIGTSLGIGITAEGVETMEHAHVLRDLGVSVLQGYAFARPMPSQALMDFMRAQAQKSA